MALHSCPCLGREVRRDATGKEIVAYSHAVPHGLGQISREGFRTVPSVGIMRTSGLERDSGQLTNHACIQLVHEAYVGWHRADAMTHRLLIHQTATHLIKLFK